MQSDSFESAVSAAFDSVAPTSETPDAPVAVEAPASDAPAPAEFAPETPAAAPTPATLSDDTLVEVMVDGQPQQMAWKDARRSISATAASTQRFQQAAEARRQADALAQQAQGDIARAAQVQQQMQHILSDPNRLAALYAAQVAAQQGQPQGQPQAPPDLNQFAQQIMSQADQLFQSRFAAAQQQQQATELEQTLVSYTKGLAQDDAILSQFVDDRLGRWFDEVAKMGPTSVDQAKGWLADRVTETKASIRSALDTQLKQSATVKAKAAVAVERGGSPVTAPAKPPTLFGDDMERAILDHLNAMVVK